MGSAWVNYHELKASVSIPQVLGHYGLLSGMKQRGEVLEGPCPIHKGHGPRQFRTTPSGHGYYCHGRCAAGGNVLDFVAAMEGVSIREAALLLVRWFKLQGTATTARPKKNSSAPAGDRKRKRRST